MATRSRIGIKYETGKIRSVYCHWDGYPDYNGKVLRESYHNTFKVQELINRGDLASLKHTLEEIDFFSDRQECKDTGETRPAVSHNSIADFLKDVDGEEYGYIFDLTEEIPCWKCWKVSTRKQIF